MKTVQQETQAIYLEGVHASAVAEERWYSAALSFVKFQVIDFSSFHRDVMGNNLSVLNANVLVGLKTASTQLVKNDPKCRFWRTISVNWKRAFRRCRTHKHRAIGGFRLHKRQPLGL